MLCGADFGCGRDSRWPHMRRGLNALPRRRCLSSGKGRVGHAAGLIGVQGLAGFGARHPPGSSIKPLGGSNPSRSYEVGGVSAALRRCAHIPTRPSARCLACAPGTVARFARFRQAAAILGCPPARLDLSAHTRFGRLAMGSYLHETGHDWQESNLRPTDSRFRPATCYPVFLPH